MRVLFTTQPGAGHLHPLLPVAAGLRARGAEVRFASSPLFVPQIEATGFAAFPAGIAWGTAEMAKTFPDIAQIPPGPDRYAWARSNIFAGHTAIASTPDLLAIAEHWRPDIIVREAAEYGGCLAAECLDVAHVVVRTDTASSSYTRRHHVAHALATARARVGLPPDPDTCMPFRHLQLSFAPAGLDDPDDARAPSYRLFRPVAESGQDGLPAPWLDGLPAQPTVYVTLGTVFNHSTELFSSILAALATERVNLIVTVGRDQDPAQFGPQPDHIRIERWIPQHRVLPQTDLVVAHGGFGTIAAALTEGIPLVLLPISADQPINAARCVSLGVGRSVEPCDRTPSAIRAAARSVLHDARYHHRARRVADETRELPDLDDALDLVEQLACDRAPHDR